MPRITKKLLEERVTFLHDKLNQMETEARLLDKEIELLRSSHSGPGQLSIMVEALERISDAAAHVVTTLSRKYNER